MTFTTEISKAPKINGITGWNWIIRRSDGAICGSGWTAGRKSDAKESADSALRFHQNMHYANRLPR